MVKWFTPIDSPVTPVRFVRKNERRETRRSIEVPCYVVRERDFKLIADRSLDLSPDGMLVATEYDVAPDEDVLVSFQATSLGLWFDTEAKITRVVRGRRAGDRGRAAALAFSSLDRVRRFILRGHLRRVPPPIPRRAQRIDWSATVRSFA